MTRVHAFDEWVDYFRWRQSDIGLEANELREFTFETKFGEPEEGTIEFGHFRGQRKWPTLMHIPTQQIRDALRTLIVYQGDTEFASVEQQRSLLQNAPSDYDLLAIMRVMAEEMRHGWQMIYLLVAHFGDEGKREAQKLLERRAAEGKRLLGSFNERENPRPADRAHLNEASRVLYREEVCRLADRLNQLIPDRERWLYVPELSFNRRIGRYGRQCFDVHGRRVDADAYPAYLASVTPSEADHTWLAGVFKEPNWIAPKKGDSLEM